MLDKLRAWLTCHVAVPQRDLTRGGMGIARSHLPCQPAPAVSVAASKPASKTVSIAAAMMTPNREEASAPGGSRAVTNGALDPVQAWSKAGLIHY